MRAVTSAFFAICLAGAACAGVMPQSTVRELVDYAFVYEGAHRTIGLRDGSHVIVYTATELENEPNPIDAIIVSPRGRDADRSLRVALWIPNEVAPGTTGQIFSAALSDDHKTLAVVGGWKGAADKRGHNGVFILRQSNPNEGWRLQSWFDVRGAAIGEVEMGPDDTVLLTYHEARATGASAPVMAIYSWSGQRLGLFLDTAGHGDFRRAASTHTMRFARLGGSKYALYDPEPGIVRNFRVTTKGTGIGVSEDDAVAVPFQGWANVLAFDPRPDGRIVFARTISENGHPRTVVTMVRSDGTVADEFDAPETWRLGYAYANALHGIGKSRGNAPLSLRTVTVR